MGALIFLARYRDPPATRPPAKRTAPTGTLVDPRSDFRQFQKLLTRAGLPSVQLHDLRHTAASLLLAQHVPARVVMEILGHSQIALTMNTYSHVAPEVSREAADRMARHHRKWL